jgi:2-keto-4-pentenoate hydratase/2-oxohepta-3-ene-1,7-dioic acid hydratase in catechol pathway
LSAERPIATQRILPPVNSPGKIVAVGRNYREHAAEESAALPTAPLLFAKFPSALVGDGANITWSAALSSQVDYEAELAVVIGHPARNVAIDRALDHVLGYTCLNDVSARDLQVSDGQWTRAKSLDTFCPMGPWLVTADEVPDPGTLRLRCRVNGEVRQDASTAELVHGVAELIAYCSESFTLEPGDVIATGTPGGVGAFRDPPVFLADGDTVEVEIERVGTLTNRCRVVP